VYKFVEKGIPVILCELCLPSEEQPGVCGQVISDLQGNFGKSLLNQGLDAVSDEFFVPFSGEAKGDMSGIAMAGAGPDRGDEGEPVNLFDIFGNGLVQGRALLFRELLVNDFFFLGGEKHGVEFYLV
jgi:hypothetical protein